MELKRPAIKTTEDQHREGEDSGVPPSSRRRVPIFVDKDEAFPLVSVLFHALESVQQTAAFANDARDANDEESAEFFEDCQRDAMKRAERAKALLLAKLTHESNERGRMAALTT